MFLAYARPRSEPKHKERERGKDLKEPGAFKLVEGGADFFLCCPDLLGQDVATHRHDAAMAGPSSQTDEESLLDHAFAGLTTSSFGNVA
jgi:hypothetical protein